MHNKRSQLPNWRNKVMSAEAAAQLIENHMIVAMSGFTRAGEAKAVPLALAARAKNESLKITLMTGASLGNDIDAKLTEAKVLHKRLPFQVDNTLRKAINAGEVLFIDQHLSETVERIRNLQMPAPDVAIIEACRITAEGYIVPTASIGNSASFALSAKKVIIELNASAPEALNGLHDVYIPQHRPNRREIPLYQVNDRIGTPYIPIDAEQIAAIVLTDIQDSPSNVKAVDAETQKIADHLMRFFSAEINAGRLPPTLRPLQAGIGTMANAVMEGFLHGPFEHLVMYSEVLQDSTFTLLDHGKMDFASGCSMTLTESCGARIWPHLNDYRDRLILRPQEISNHPELLRRLGTIAINTALEADIYGNVNSTHVCGTQMMNGIGGSGDFARNSQLSIFVTKATAKNNAISSIVPFASHIDHTEHDVDILVTEQGLADLRNLAPRERALVIIENCADPIYRPALFDYFERACRRGGQTPHCLEEALAWHETFRKEGNMQKFAARVSQGATP